MSSFGKIWKKFWGNSDVQKKVEQAETVVESKVQQEVWAAEKAKAETIAIEAKAKLDLALGEKTRIETFGMKVKVWEDFCQAINANFKNKSEEEKSMLKEEMLTHIMGIESVGRKNEIANTEEVLTLKQSSDE